MSKNKSVEGHLGLLKARIVKLRRGHVESIMCSCAAKGEGFDDTKLGDAWIGHIDFPSIGKNTLLNALTNAFQKSKKENSPH